MRLWTHKLEPGAAFDCSSYGYSPIIRSVCLSGDGTSILLGVKSSEIFEVNCFLLLYFDVGFVCCTCYLDLFIVLILLCCVSWWLRQNMISHSCDM